MCAYARRKNRRDFHGRRPTKKKEDDNTIGKFEPTADPPISHDNIKGGEKSTNSPMR